MPTPNPSKINSCLFVIIQCTAIAAMIVGIANLFFKDFFFIDDAQNQNLPFYREIGRIWLSGHLPILTTNTFLGGNLLLDMVTSPFAPQTILTSLLSTQIESFRVVANFLAWMNISLVMLGAYWLGRVYAIRPGSCLLLSFSVATNPIFLYVFAANWCNLASAFAWFMISFAAIMHFRAKPTIKLYCVGVGSVCALFASAGTHIQIAFLLFTAIIVIYDFVYERTPIKLLNFISIIVCALLISAVPIMLEFILSKDLIVRFSQFNNNTALAVPSWGFIVNFYNPYYGTYMNSWDGFRFMPLSFGYATILAPLMFFSHQFHNTKTLGVFSYLLCCSILLSFSSSQLGPLILPVRFLPLFGVLVVFITFYLLEHSEFIITKTRIKFFINAILFSATTQLFSADNVVFESKNSIFVLFFIGLSFAVFKTATVAYKKRTGYSTSVLAVIVFLTWLSMIAKTPSLADGYVKLLSYTALQPTLSEAPTKKPETYALGLAPGKHSTISNLYSGRFLLFDFKSINGYSPVGHKALNQYLPHYGAQGEFDPESTLLHLMQRSDIDPNIFDYQLFNIGHFFTLRSTMTPNLLKVLTEAQITIDPQLHDDRYLLIAPKRPYATQGSLTYSTVTNSITLDHQDGMLHEWFNVEPTPIARTLIFSRVYWFGYHAEMNGKEYPISTYKNVLLKVDFPADVHGKMHLYFEPISWRFSRWSIVVGVLLFLTVIFRLKYDTKPRFKQGLI